MRELSESILSTLIYYDILDYPLTSFEIWKYLISRKYKVESIKQDDVEARHGASLTTEITLKDILSELESEELKNHLEEYRGFYFLKGRKDLVSQRLERNNISEIKYKKILKVVHWLRFVPFIRMIGVTGRVAMKNADRESDLDLLIVLKDGHIFTGRFLVTFFTHIIGKRRYGQKITDRICLNYYITTDSLEINLQDLFSSGEYLFMLPVYGFDVYRKFQEENQWISKYRPNYYVHDVSNRKIIKDSYFSKKIRNVGEKILGSRKIEKILKSFQVKKIKSNPKTNLSGSMIVADNNALIFLPEPQGPGVYDRFRERMEELV